MVAVLFIVFLVALAIGVPVAFSLGLASVAYMLGAHIQMINFAQYFFKGLDSFTLLCIPGFTFAGNLMNQGGISEKLLDFADALVGHITGGLAYANVLASMVFAGISGTALSDTVALGGVEIPMMVNQGYDVPFSVAITAASSCLGPIIPPSLPMVIFGVLSGASVTKMFIGGVVPGVITGLVCMLAWYFMNKNKNYALMPKATPREVWTAFKKAFPALMMPVIMMGGILSGIFTPTEAGVVACVYAWAVSTFLYKKMNMKILKRVAIASAKSTAVIMLIVAACQALAMVITVARIPQAIAAAISAISSNRLVVMCLINVFVLIVGLFMDVTPALTILTPIFLPIVVGIGMDPIVFGVTMVYGLCIGLITPPVGNVLYIGIGISKITLLDLLKKIWPMVALYTAVLFLMTAVPGLITFLPNLFAGA